MDVASEVESRTWLNREHGCHRNQERVMGFEPTTCSLGSYPNTDENPSKTRVKRKSANSVTSTVTLGSHNSAKLPSVDNASLKRLIELFTLADDGKRAALLAVAEAMNGNCSQ